MMKFVTVSLDPYAYGLMGGRYLSLPAMQSFTAIYLNPVLRLLECHVMPFLFIKVFFKINFRSSLSMKILGIEILFSFFIFQLRK